MKSTSHKNPVIFSASRRTDLVGWYPETLAEILSKRMDRFRSRYLYGVVFWTRFPMNLVRGTLGDILDKKLDNVVVNLSITGLGSTFFEPNAPETGEVLKTLPKLVKLLGDPSRLRWRFDPLLYKVSDPAVFEQIAKKISGLGSKTCTFSFPAQRSLRGSLKPQYETAKIEPWPDKSNRDSFLISLADIAEKHGIQLLSCSQPENTLSDKRIMPAQCIPLNILRDLHPQGYDYPEIKDYSQRKHCLCPRSEELGDYTKHRCRTGCVYCYSPAGGPF